LADGLLVIVESLDELDSFTGAFALVPLAGSGDVMGSVMATASGAVEAVISSGAGAARVAGFAAGVQFHKPALFGSHSHALETLRDVLSGRFSGTGAWLLQAHRSRLAKTITVRTSTPNSQ